MKRPSPWWDLPPLPDWALLTLAIVVIVCFGLAIVITVITLASRETHQEKFNVDTGEWIRIP